MATYNGAASSEDLNQQPNKNESKGSENNQNTSRNRRRKYSEGTFTNSQRSGHSSAKQETKIEDNSVVRDTPSRQSRRGKKQVPSVDISHKTTSKNLSPAAHPVKNENSEKPPRPPKSKPAEKEKQVTKGVSTSEPLASNKSHCVHTLADGTALLFGKDEQISVMSEARKLNKPRNKATQTEILGIVFAHETELPMEFQKKNQVSTMKWEELTNQHKKTKHAGTAMKNINQENDKPKNETGTVPRRNIGNDDINDKNLNELQQLRQDTEKKVKDFWGPLEEVEPLQIKIGQILKAFSKKFPAECVKSLEDASKLLKQRTPLIESASGGQDCSSDSDSEQEGAGDTKVKVMKIGMQALELYKELSLATSRDHSKLLSLQLKFTKCQTELDAISSLTPGDNSVVNIHVLCNDALNVLEGLLDLNHKFHSVLSIGKSAA